ncbi:MAG: Ycf51 family protein, partial [Cyanobacteria bacterium J06641_5]
MLESLPTDFGFYLKWSGILTLVSLTLAVVSFAFGWGVRFRLVGVTGFLAVLTGGIFGLSLGLFQRVDVPNAVAYRVVFDNGGDRVVAKVKTPISPEQVEATLQKAAIELFSYGRLGSAPELSIRLRTTIHPEPGISEPLYLGEVRRSLVTRANDGTEITVFRDRIERLAQLSSAE